MKLKIRSMLIKNLKKFKLIKWGWRKKIRLNRLRKLRVWQKERSVFKHFKKRMLPVTMTLKEWVEILNQGQRHMVRAKKVNKMDLMRKMMTLVMRIWAKVTLMILMVKTVMRAVLHSFLVRMKCETIWFRQFKKSCKSVTIYKERTMSSKNKFLLWILIMTVRGSPMSKWMSTSILTHLLTCIKFESI